ncbi:hypothetical protein HNY73_015668 [Argiope bruennichi]|uniref:Uncharacterized protein n=1 Tax=Argiope bruennichi TaxID=94029 RepID=A0A8T0EG33_ARGBR|nr:hypothetical protein HNY73_015668 [Argiope bruennichi]
MTPPLGGSTCDVRSGGRGLNQPNHASRLQFVAIFWLDRFSSMEEFAYLWNGNGLEREKKACCAKPL